METLGALADSLHLTTLKALYDEVLNLADPRVANWPLMSSPFGGIFLSLTYIWIVTSLGPRLMRGREPYGMRIAMILYNFGMVAFSSYMFYEFAMGGWFTGYSLRCQPVDYSAKPAGVRMAFACYLYFISKYVEFFDTGFFILRKKFAHITFLHVFHHTAMALGAWLFVKFAPGGHISLDAMINTFIHIVMYSYYGLAAFGPGMQKYLWWKRYLTLMQMAQFLLVFCHAGLLFFVNCNFPIIGAWLTCTYCAAFFALFANFYRNAYGRGVRAPAKRTSAPLDTLNYLGVTVSSKATDKRRQVASTTENGTRKRTAKRN